MKNKIINYTSLSIVKYIFLIFLWCFLIYAFEFAFEFDSGESLYEQIKDSYLHGPGYDNERFEDNKIVYLIYTPIRYLGLVLSVFGICFNVYTKNIIQKSESKGQLVLIGIVKIFTLAFVTGIMTLMYGINYDSYKNEVDEEEDESLNEYPILNDINDKKDENIIESEESFKKFSFEDVEKSIKEYKSYRISTISIIGLIIHGIILIFIGWMLCQDIEPMPEDVFAVFLLIFIVALVFFIKCVFGYGNIRRCFRKNYRQTRKGMTVEQVKNIMRVYRIEECGYTSDNTYILKYTVSRFRQYESVSFKFQDDKMYSYSTGYRRIKTYRYYR